LPKNCHSEEGGGEESLGSSIKILRFTQNDSITEFFAASLLSYASFVHPKAQFAANSSSG